MTTTTIIPVPLRFLDLTPEDRAMYQDANIPVSQSSWTFKTPTVAFRLWGHRGCLRLWRKTLNTAAFGGYQIHTVVADSGLAREWLATE